MMVRPLLFICYAFGPQLWPALRIRYVEVATPSSSRIRRIVAVCNWQRLQVCGGDSSAAAVANTSQIFHLARRFFMS